MCTQARIDGHRSQIDFLQTQLTTQTDVLASFRRQLHRADSDLLALEDDIREKEGSRNLVCGAVTILGLLCGQRTAELNRLIEQRPILQDRLSGLKDLVAGRERVVTNLQSNLVIERAALSAAVACFERGGPGPGDREGGTLGIPEGIIPDDDDDDDDDDPGVVNPGDSLVPEPETEDDDDDDDTPPDIPVPPPPATPEAPNLGYTLTVNGIPNGTSISVPDPTHFPVAVSVQITPADSRASVSGSLSGSIAENGGTFIATFTITHPGDSTTSPPIRAGSFTGSVTVTATAEGPAPPPPGEADVTFAEVFVNGSSVGRRLGGTVYVETFPTTVSAAMTASSPTAAVSGGGSEDLNRNGDSASFVFTITNSRDPDGSPTTQRSASYTVTVTAVLGEEPPPPPEETDSGRFIVSNATTTRWRWGIRSLFTGGSIVPYEQNLSQFGLEHPRAIFAVGATYWVVDDGYGAVAAFNAFTGDRDFG